MTNLSLPFFPCVYLQYLYVYLFVCCFRLYQEFTYVAERLEVGLSTTVLTIRSVAIVIRTPDLLHESRFLWPDFLGDKEYIFSRTRKFRNFLLHFEENYLFYFNYYFTNSIHGYGQYHLTMEIVFCANDLVFRLLWGTFNYFYYRRYNHFKGFILLFSFTISVI